MRRYIPKAVKDIALHMMDQEALTDKLIQCYTGISVRSLKRLRKTYRETGESVRVPVCNGRPRELDSLDTAFIEGCIERQPDIFLKELQDLLCEVCGTYVSLPTIARTLHRRGFTRKKVNRPAIERDEIDRVAYKMLIGEHFNPSHLVFVDESNFNRISLQRQYAWAPCGTRARRRDFFIRGCRYSILPALSLDGILHLEVLDHAFTGEEFKEFIQGVLDQMQPWPLPNSVLMMDNARIHTIPGIRETVEERGMRLIYLPSYSPDLNPIEECFSVTKSWLRANRDYVLGEMEGYANDPYALIWEAVYTAVSPEKIYGWYKHSEYIV